MRRFKAKKIRIPWYMTKKCIAIEILVFVVLLHGLFGIVSKRNIAYQELSIVKEEEATVISSFDSLENEVMRLETPYGEEETLRQIFGVTKPFEREIKIIQSIDSEVKLLPLEEKKSWWRNLWENNL